MNNAEHDKEQKSSKVFLVFAGICILALPLVVWSAFSNPPEVSAPVTAIPTRLANFDNQGKAIFESYDRIVNEYLEGVSTERTLEMYYGRRQYLGSPPFIPHKVEDSDGAEMACLTCHADGGWTEDLKKHTPLTPHPEQTACQQCHIPETEEKLFVSNEWMSVQPPRLGRAHLPGGPPPIPHQLQMRGNCLACHVGPGAVTAIRVQHPMRGNCRQCHVPDLLPGLFQRDSDY